MELIVYRIVQELVQNVIKHANASHAGIQISKHEKTLNIVVEDNGRGFGNKEKHTGIGLNNIQHRVTALQGYLSIDFVKGKCTAIFMEFDLEKLIHAIKMVPAGLEYIEPALMEKLGLVDK